MNQRTITFDASVNAIYIEFSAHEIAETIELSKSVFVDVDADGEPVGFEILNASPDLVKSLQSLTGPITLEKLMDRTAA